MTRIVQSAGTPSRRTRQVLCAACLLVAMLAFLPHPMRAQEDVLSAILKQGQIALEDELYSLAEKRLSIYLERGAYSLPPAQVEKGFALFLESLHGQKRHQNILAAFETHSDWLRRIGKSPTLSYWRALAHYELKQVDLALAELGAVPAQARPADYAPRFEHLTAWCLLKSDKPDQAIRTFSAYVTAYPELATVPPHLLEWSRAILPTHRRDAMRFLERLAKLPPENPAVQEGQRELGRLLIEARRWSDAQTALVPLSTNVAAHADLRAQAWFSLAIVQEARTNRLEAIRLLTNGIQQAKSPKLKQKGAYEQGRILVDMGKLDQGIPLLKNFVSAAPTNPLAGKTQLRIAGVLLDSGKHAEARDEFQSYLETFTNQVGRAQAYRGKGWALLHTSRFAEAATEFTKGFELFSDVERREECLFKTGDAYFANSQYQLASQTYDRFLSTFPQSKRLPNVFFQLAESLLQANEPMKAETMFLALVEKYPSDPAAAEGLLRVAEIKVRLAEGLDRGGRWSDSEKALADAVSVFTQVINVYSNSPVLAEALHGRGRAQYYRYQFGDALANFKRVVTGHKESTVFEHASYMLGRCYYSMAQDRRALEVWRGFVKVHATSTWTPRILFELGKYEYSSGNYEEAEKQFLSFVKTFPADPQADHALLRAGKSAYHRKEYRHSVELLGRFAKEYPTSTRLAEARFEQAEALFQLAEYAAVILICDEIANKSKDNELVILAQLRKGDCQFWLGAEDKERYQEAINSYRAVANNSDAALHLVYEALYKIGRCLEKLERIDEALKQYHSNVMVRFLDEQNKGVQHNQMTKTWFWRASKAAADIMEAREEWRKVIKILERAVDVGVPDAEEARERIKQIRTERWWLFF